MEHVVILAKEEFMNVLKDRIKQLLKDEDIVTVFSRKDITFNDSRPSSRIRQIMDKANCNVTDYHVSLILHDSDIFGENRGVFQSRCGKFDNAFYCTFHHQKGCTTYDIIMDGIMNSMEDLKKEVIKAH